MTVVVRPHDPEWQSLYEEEARVLGEILGDNLVAAHHIGSTAIPGVWAKPIIDILLEVDSIERLDQSSAALVGVGYEAMGEYGIPGRRYFRKSRPNGERSHHVHAFGRADPGVERHLAFRDFMLAHPGIARQYSNLKRRLARRHPEDMEAYVRGKEPFVREMEQRAVIWRRATLSP